MRRGAAASLAAVEAAGKADAGRECCAALNVKEIAGSTRLKKTSSVRILWTGGGAVVLHPLLPYDNSIKSRFGFEQDG
jgi:hypothetical protein